MKEIQVLQRLSSESTKSLQQSEDNLNLIQKLRDEVKSKEKQITNLEETLLCMEKELLEFRSQSILLEHDKLLIDKENERRMSMVPTFEQDAKIQLKFEAMRDQL